jgi:hypothetical protein
VWVRANDCDQARESVSGITLVETPHFPGKSASPPWKNPALVTCLQDAEYAAPEGKLLLADGRTLPDSD